VRASAAPPPPLPHRSHARPPSPALAGEASQAARAAAAVKIVDDFKLKPGSITGATIMSCGEDAIRTRLGAAAAGAAQLAVVEALVSEAKAAKAASGACARGSRACPRRRRVRASAAPPPPLPHRSHARPPSPALAGALTELQQLTAANPKARKSFVDYLAKHASAVYALLQPLDAATPLLLRFDTGLAPHADQLRAVLALEEFKGVMKTSAQNAAAGACESGRRRESAAGDLYGRVLGSV
jgi:hypothetical protein